MNEDLKKAIALLPGHSCVFCRGDAVYTRDQSGVAPLLHLLGTDLAGFSVADKIVGRAAAMLYCLMGVTSVSAPVMSRGGAQMLKTHGIEAYWQQCPEAIQNRKGDGICPMEQAVKEIQDPAMAPDILRKTLEGLRK